MTDKTAEGAKRPKLKVSEVRAELWKLDIRLGRTEQMEWRVTFATLPPGEGRDFFERTAYYTNDLADALDTGRAMAKERDSKEPA